MPISQHRVIGIVNAGNTYRIFTESVQRILLSASHGKITHEAAYNQIADTFIDSEPDMRYARQVLDAELIHYNITAHRNDTERERIAARRAGRKFIPPTADSLEARVARHELAKQHGGMRPKRTIPELPADPDFIEAAIGPEDNTLDLDGWSETIEAEYRKTMGKPRTTEE